MHTDIIMDYKLQIRQATTNSHTETIEAIKVCLRANDYQREECKQSVLFAKWYRKAPGGYKGFCQKDSELSMIMTVVDNDTETMLLIGFSS